MDKKTFTEIFSSTRGSDRDKLLFDLSKKCGVTYRSIEQWGYGYRIPKKLYREEISKYFKKSEKQLFPKESN